MAGLLDPATIPALLTGVLMLALALALLVVDFNNVLHRVFSLVLTFQGLVYFIGVARYGTDPDTHLFLTGLFPYLQFPLIPLYLLFIALYPHPRNIGRWRWTWVVAAVLSVGVLLWYMLDHSAYGTIGPTPEGWVNSAGAGMAYLEFGPLFAILQSRRILPGLLALILARDYWKEPQGSAGFSRFLVYAGFALNALFNGVIAVQNLVSTVGNDIQFPWWPYGWTQIVMPVLSFPLVLASLVYIFLASRGEKDTPTLQEPRRFLYYVAPLPILSAIILGVPALASRFSATIFFIIGIWWLSIPILITYALMRFQVFGADVRIKQSVAKVVLTVLFTVIFFALLEAAEALLGDSLGIWLNIGLAAVLALTASPLQRLASRVADSVMPDAKSVYEQDPFERGEFYRSQYELVHDDGVVSAKDRDMLDRLALSLRISKTQQKQLEKGENTLPRIEGYSASVEDEQRSKWSTALAALLTAALFGAIGQGLESLFPSDDFGLSLISAAVVAIMIGPLASLSDRILEPPSERKARHDRVSTYRQAVVAAFIDGNITVKERQYLDRLQKELGLTQTERIRIHMRTARSVS